MPGMPDILRVAGGKDESVWFTHDKSNRPSATKKKLRNSKIRRRRGARGKKLMIDKNTRREQDAP
jgi:hypothetical protein